jgi:hypothetical protein
VVIGLLDLGSTYATFISNVVQPAAPAPRLH